MIDITGLREDKRPQSSRIVHALLDRLEAAEKEREIDEERIADLMAELNRVGHENDALRAKIAEMERQEPVAKVESWTNGSYTRHYKLKWLRDVNEGAKLYALPGAQQCKNCNGMGDRFDPSGEKIPCDLCESNLEEIRVLVAEAAHDIISGGDFWLSTSLAAKKVYALPGAQPAPSVPSYIELMREAQRVVESKPIFRRFVAGTPLENDIAVWMADFAAAQPAPSIPDDVMRDAVRYRFLRAAKNIPISSKAARDPVVYDAAIDAAMLAAAPEAKP